MKEVALALQEFVTKVKPKSLMIAGPCERTEVGIADLVCKTLCLCLSSK